MITICEDNAAELAALREICREYLRDRNPGEAVFCCASAEEYWNSGHAGREDVLLLDIYLGDADGTQLARTLRGKGFDGAIIFITSSPEHALAGFEVGAADYLVKPVRPAAFAEAMERARKLAARRQRAITVTSNYHKRTILLDSILYIETRDHKTWLVTQAERLPVSASLAELMGMLDGAQFLQCFRGYIINMDRVGQMGTEHFIMENGERIPIARRGAAAIKNAYTAHTFARGRVDGRT